SMASAFSFGTMPPATPVDGPKADTPFRIGVLGDFTGRQNRREGGPVAARHLVRVGRDTLDDGIAKMNVRLVLPVDQQTAIPVSFGSIVAFHPDQLNDRLDYVANSDEAENEAAWMNWVLHQADFQALESVWRGLEWLLARTSKINKVEVVLLDICLPELA